MFALDHRRDFDAILRASEPFALIRFGDGEAALLSGKSHHAANREWVAWDGAHWLQAPLRAALQRNAPGMCVGVPSRCCLHTSMDAYVEARVPPGHMTFATLFLHGNLRRFGELLTTYKPVVVGPDGPIVVPRRGVETGIDLDQIVKEMMETSAPMVVAAGPLANVIIDTYWQRQDPKRRQMVLDVGSALDFHLSRTPTRQYHQGVTLSHHCELNAAPLVAGRVAPRTKIVASRGVKPMPIVVHQGSAATSSNRARNGAVVIGGRSQTSRRSVLPAINAATSGVTVIPTPYTATCRKCARSSRRR